MQLAYTILYVENVDQTLTFFETAFGIKRKMLYEGGDYGELDTGATTLSFAKLELMRTLGKNPAPAAKGNPTFEISFTTDDVAGALKKAVAAGAELVQDAKDMPWGQTTASVTDPNGFLIELCTPMKPS